MELHVVIDGDKDLTGQLYRQLKEAIRSGRLAAGERLPPSRLLAEQLGLSRKTVGEAYATAGIHLAALCRRPIDMDMLLRLARRVDVGLYSLDGFHHAGPARQGLMMGFGAIETEDIDPSLDRLRDILAQMA